MLGTKIKGYWFLSDKCLHLSTIINIFWFSNLKDQKAKYTNAFRQTKNEANENVNEANDRP